MTNQFLKLLINDITKSNFQFWGLLFVLAFSNIAFSQTGNYLTVLDAPTGEPMVGVHVKFESTSGEGSPEVRYAVTDINGKVEIPFDAPVQVEVSFIGHRTIIETLTDDTPSEARLEPLYQDLSEVVITGQSSATDAKNSIHEIRVLDRDVIDEKGANNLNELLQTELGVQLTQDNILGSSISLQGMGGEKVKILVDGVPMIGRVNGNIDLSQINLNNVERIEIVEGPMAVLYGSDALGGVINLITKDHQSNKWEAEAGGYYESVGQYNFDGRLGLNLDRHFIQVDGGRNFFMGWPVPDTMRASQWKPKEQIFGDFTYRWTGDQFIVKFDSRYFWEKITNRQNPNQAPYISAYDEIYKTFRATNAVDFKAFFENDKSLNVLFAYSEFKRTKNRYIKNLTTLETNLTTQPGDQDTSRFNEVKLQAVFASYSSKKKITYNMGIDLEHQRAHGARIEDGFQQLGNYAVFGSFDYQPIEQLVIQPSVRIVYNTKYQAPLIPSLNIRYAPTSNWIFRMSYARGFRAPSLKELYFEFVDVNHNLYGNEDLLAETSHNTQFSINWVKQIQGSYLEVKNRFYFNDIDNEISLQPIDSVRFAYLNIENSQTIGNAIELSYGWKNLLIETGFLYNGVKNGFDQSLSDRGISLDTSLTAAVTYAIPKWKLNFRVNYKWTGESPVYYIVDDEFNVEEGRLSAYQMLDASVSKRFWNDRINLTIGGKNLLNVRDIESNLVQSGGVHSGGDASLPVGWGASFFAKARILLFK